MRIAIYYPWLYLTSGVERTILEIVKKSKHKYTIFTNHYDRNKTYPEFKKFKIVELKEVPISRDIFSVLKASFIIAFQKINLTNYDILFVHSDGIADLISLRNRHCPIVCFCHTPLRPVFDEYYRQSIVKKKNLFYKIFFYFFSYFFKKIDQIIWKQFIFILFNSKETLRRAKNGGLIKERDRKRFLILHPGVDFENMSPSWVYKPYFFLPGRIMWTKNIEFGINSFILFKNRYQEFSKFKLIVAGQVDLKSKAYFQKLKRISKGRDDIEFIVSPSDFVIKKFYLSCTAVLSCSFNEDWGITLIEGNAFGKASIALDRGGIKESQIKGKTGYLVEQNEDAYAEFLAKMAGNEKLTKKLGKNARLNAKKYDWNYFIQRLDNFLTSLGNL